MSKRSNFDVCINEKTKRKNIKKQKIQEAGITLIALVVTIIILLILAGISISMVSQNDGVLGRAKNAADTYKKSEANEIKSLSNYEYELQKAFGETIIIKQDGTPVTLTSDTVKDLYGQVVDYHPENDPKGIYRIFYCDTSNKYGDGVGTIYLKRDWTANDTNLYNIVYSTTYTPSDESDAHKKMLAINPDYAAKSKRNEVEYSNMRENEKQVMWLCDTSNFTEYYVTDDTNKYKDYINYVIGSPSVEMYVDSYNSVSHATVTVEGAKGKKLGASYRHNTDEGDADNSYGYIHTFDGEKSTVATADGRSESDWWYTGYESIDFQEYNSMYCGNNRQKGFYYWFLASPSSLQAEYVCNVNGNEARLGGSSGNLTLGLCPIVSLKPGVQLNLE